MRKKQLQRLEIVESFLRLGFTQKEIASELKMSQSTVVLDVCAIKKAGLRILRLSKKERFVLRLKRYAELELALEHAADPLERTTKNVLVKALKIRELLSLLKCITLARDILLTPQVKSEQSAYADLVYAVYPNIKRASQKSEEDAPLFFREYLTGIAKGTMLTPENETSFHYDVVARFVESWGKHIAPVWPDQVPALVETELKKLPQKTAEILRFYFGIGEKPMNLAEIGRIYNITRSRTSQIKGAGLKQLREMGRLKVLIDPICSIAAISLEEVVRHEAQEKERVTAKLMKSVAAEYFLAAGELLIPFDVLLKEVAWELEVSVRTANCLDAARIVYIGDLIQWTDKELLQLPYFGRKSLHELKCVLSNMGLLLGLRFNEEAQEKYEEMRKNRK